MESVTSASVADVQQADDVLGTVVSEAMMEEYGEEMSGEIDYSKSLISEPDEARLGSVMQKATAGEPVTMAFLGGSITQGSAATKEEYRYVNRVAAWWEQTYPESALTFINAGIGATGSDLGVARVQEDVLAYSPDLVFVEFSVNDADDFHAQETYEGLVRRILSADNPPALVLIHNMRYDNLATAEHMHSLVGEHYNLACLSLKNCVGQAIIDGQLDWHTVSADGLHPNDKGMELLAGMVTSYLAEVNERAKKLTDSVSQRTKPLPSANSMQLTDSVSQRLTLPDPLTKNRYQASTRYRNMDITPIVCDGFTADTEPQQGTWDCFKCGWRANELGSKVEFDIEGSCIAVQYCKTICKPAPVATVTVDGMFETELDANFTENWGDCLYLQPVTTEAGDGVHRVVIEVTSASPDDRGDMNIVSLIAG